MSFLNYTKRVIHNKYGIHRRDIFVFITFFAIFFLAKEQIIESYLNIAAKKYIKINGISTIDLSKLALQQENAELKHLLALDNQAKSAEHEVVFAKVLSNIYSSTTFWIYVKDSSKIKKNQAVWCDDSRIGKRIIGFVEYIHKNYVKVIPITHKNAKFSAKTLDGSNLLLQGNNLRCKIILSSSEHVAENSLVIFDDIFKVGITRNDQTVECKEFKGIKFVCINI